MRQQILIQENGQRSPICCRFTVSRLLGDHRSNPRRASRRSEPEEIVLPSYPEIKRLGSYKSISNRISPFLWCPSPPRPEEV
jgi:hypothetical protein